MYIYSSFTLPYLDFNNYGSCFGRNLYCSEQAVYSMTFDEGPSSATKQILQVLKEKGVTATFFLSGDAVEASPATAKAIVDAGCEIGSNSYSDDSLKGQDKDCHTRPCFLVGIQVKR